MGKVIDFEEREFRRWFMEQEAEGLEALECALDCLGGWLTHGLLELAAAAHKEQLPSQADMWPNIRARIDEIVAVANDNVPLETALINLHYRLDAANPSHLIVDHLLTMAQRALINGCENINSRELLTSLLPAAEMLTRIERKT